ncbi:hypothetical protein E2C01_009898 [Portunus trituberculatus]|uniref:Uncharacterized protein n=1 Tax=Portunus trituberculatus TaxID=210409 RepID=A0A5B7D779_PORTR|nr:hypothetical protein [Portunus trituberculatus]
MRGVQVWDDLASAMGIAEGVRQAWAGGRSSLESLGRRTLELLAVWDQQHREEPDTKAEVYSRGQVNEPNQTKPQVMYF